VGIGRRHGEAYAAHDRRVGEVVADVGHFATVNPRLGQDLFEDRNLLDVALYSLDDSRKSEKP
jgi:hypothetical protein